MGRPRKVQGVQDALSAPFLLPQAGAPLRRLLLAILLRPTLATGFSELPTVLALDAVMEAKHGALGPLALFAAGLAVCDVPVESPSHL